MKALAPRSIYLKSERYFLIVRTQHNVDSKKFPPRLAEISGCLRKGVDRGNLFLAPTGVSHMGAGYPPIRWVLPPRANNCGACMNLGWRNLIACTSLFSVTLTHTFFKARDVYGGYPPCLGLPTCMFKISKIICFFHSQCPELGKPISYQWFFLLPPYFRR